MQRSRTYLHRLWRCSPRAFCVVVVLVVAHLWPIGLQYQRAAPFYLWDMYTWPLGGQDTIRTYELRVNGRVFAEPRTAFEFRRMMWSYTIVRYALLIERGDTVARTDPDAAAVSRWFRRFPHSQPLHNTRADVEAYGPWLRRYMEQACHEPVRSLEVDELTLAYLPGGFVQAVRRKPIPL